VNPATLYPRWIRGETGREISGRIEPAHNRVGCQFESEIIIVNSWQTARAASSSRRVFESALERANFAVPASFVNHFARETRAIEAEKG